MVGADGQEAALGMEIDKEREREREREKEVHIRGGLRYTMGSGG
jgi:hypothetical protein